MIDDKLVIQEAKKYYSDNINAFDAFLHGVEFAEKILAQKRYKKLYNKPPKIIKCFRRFCIYIHITIKKLLL